MRNWYLALLIVGMLACDSSRIYENYEEVDKYWMTEDVLSYDFEINDTTVPYIVAVEIKNDLDYPFRNFYFNYRLETNSDSLLKESLQEIQLFEAKTGKPFGTGIGGQYSNELVLEEGLRFPVSGSYHIDLSQFMRIDSLTGIQRVGVRIEKVQ